MTNDDRNSQKMTPRQAEIVAIVGENGYTTLESLANRFAVSMQCIPPAWTALRVFGDIVNLRS